MEEQLAQTFLLIAAAFVAVAILARLRLSPVLGYLAAGLLLGPHGIGAVTDSEGTHFFGELGIALLMFVIGLEFSVPRLLSSGGAMIGLGFGTVAGATLLAGAASHFLVGLPLLPAALLGGAIAMSSTAIIQKHLVDTDAVSSRHGVAATGIVLFEDLVALILLSLIAALPDAANEVEMEKVLLRMGVSFVALAGVALLARRTLGRLLGWVARSGQDETFLLAVLTLVVGASLAAEMIGLSLPIGAFVVGMMVGESDFRHQLEEEIRPFRDLLLGIFFVTIGMSVDWSQILAQPAVTFLVLAAILVVKFLVVFGVTRLSGLPASSAVKTGLLLAHSGELGYSSWAGRSIAPFCRPRSASPSWARSPRACSSDRSWGSGATGPEISSGEAGIRAARRSKQPFAQHLKSSRVMLCLPAAAPWAVWSRSHSRRAKFHTWRSSETWSAFAAPNRKVIMRFSATPAEREYSRQPASIALRPSSCLSTTGIGRCASFAKPSA